ncbi:lipopolysaccharide assembly protein LapA domain-containing protein [Nocardioides marmotae]|uniref:DUF1049 domain-containing protein n=1 Tax=Nocardioides marmotae TaxID=2663857 RepID=A0A6I3JDG7_9ACTN|nr:lipopolysaccharide assembly protein LapA domain-containing protein [Nocardioides marmotae]MCR6032598.1 DUF1049 domain-containing protein [Gordonia jinghuaiqii]MBC9732331.1 DUF1049 domain-containing protein [Nocardioides marmotae]MTB83451.1 DUF1049 domain-containing protein [Nocardioides marmotae]MTB96246.1 DUF1049 domain-containing protein [Nocardioides marmotae]QKD99688.1 DUF1049 domain-containing protein [Nocardioides marmotae]
MTQTPEEPVAGTTPPADPGPTTPAQPATGPSGDRSPRRRDARADAGGDPLRGSVTSGVWAALVAFGVVLVLLVVFIAQNTEPVLVRFLGFEGETPLAVALLIAVAAGLLLTALAGSLRLWQVRRRVRREAKRH